MKIVATIMIIIGLTVGIYPVADNLYTRYLESQLIDEWEEPLFYEELSEESSSDFEQLQLVFDEAQTAPDPIGLDLPEVIDDFEATIHDDEGGRPIETEITGSISDTNLLFWK